ncbi:MFS transporter [Pochonia chlamydosporia 170]|uniref:MFS transporter n=1 Tax=Pochonia chlamydosporia 170 TaxID=1380566 RepID=A0A179G1N5_METCM|nr:MFS transporter [Pochonia chlamydosporia 170]OAQ71398.1 MFS transporter [Pochonia chlamydosporia 170]
MSSAPAADDQQQTTKSKLTINRQKPNSCNAHHLPPTNTSPKIRAHGSPISTSIVAVPHVPWPKHRSKQSSEMAHTGRRSPFNPGEASPSFAQTGAEFTLDDSDDEAIEDFDLRDEVGGEEAYEMVEREPDRGRGDRRMSASTAASFQLYTPDEDLAVRRKFDRKLVLFVALLFMLSFLDRSNIGNARIAGMDEDLQTTPPRDDWYEWALTAFYISYIAFEWMSLLFKLVPAHIVVSVTVFTWGLTASLQAIATSYPVLIALRVLLGIGEAGFTGIPFYLSFFFKREELAFRTAIFISAAPLATSFASTLAYIIVKFASLSPIAPWRLLFLIEGLPSVLASVAAFTVIPDSPSTASYLTPREKKVARLRLRHEQPTSGLQSRDLLLLLADPVAWLTSAMFFLTNMAYSSLPVFLPKIMTEMGHDALTSQALSAPPYLLAFIVVLFTAHMSDRLRARTIPIVFHALASAGGYAALALAEKINLPMFLRYMAVYPAAIGFFNVVTLIITWSINNQASQTRQGGGFAILQFIGQCGPLVGTRLYPDRDAPYYTSGMTACASAMLMVAVLAVILRWYLVRRNRKWDELESERVQDGSTMEEEVLVGSGRRKVEPARSFRYML